MEGSCGLYYVFTQSETAENTHLYGKILILWTCIDWLESRGLLGQLVIFPETCIAALFEMVERAQTLLEILPQPEITGINWPAVPTLPHLKGARRPTTPWFCRHKTWSISLSVVTQQNPPEFIHSSTSLEWLWVSTLSPEYIPLELMTVEDAI